MFIDSMHAQTASAVNSKLHIITYEFEIYEDLSLKEPL